MVEAIAEGLQNSVFQNSDGEEKRQRLHGGNKTLRNSRMF